MRRLSKDYRMQADSLAEIRRGLDRMVFEFGKVQVGSRPASEGHFINAALVHLLGLPDEERRAVLASAFEKINALMALDEPEASRVEAILSGGPGESPAGDDAGRSPKDLGAGGRIRNVSSEEPAPGKRSGGRPGS